MVISYICGGLGNQMFQYAAGRRLALQRNAEFKLDLTEYQTGLEKRSEDFKEFLRPVKLYELQVTTPAATQAEIDSLRDRFYHISVRDRLVRQVRRYIRKDFLWPDTHFRELYFPYEPKLLDAPGNLYIGGFRQSWKYFDDVRETIRRDFQPNDPNITPYARDYIGDLRQKFGPIVSLHVRRGDIAHASTLQKANVVHATPIGLDYILLAIKKFDSNTHFLVFSDTAKDIAWCKENIKGENLSPERLHFSEGHGDIQDMFLMAHCDHNVIANSTFSWWAAWLNVNASRRVIAPRKWFSAHLADRMVPEHYFPSGWEIIQV